MPKETFIESAIHNSHVIIIWVVYYILSPSE